MTQMSRKAALVISTEVIGQIEGCNGSWRFTVPESVDDLDGTARVVNADTYAQIKRRRTEEVVQLAMALMGIPGVIEFKGNETGTARNVLDMVLAEPERYIVAA